MTKKRMLSKSQINLFLQCPLKWKFVYIDNLLPQASLAQERGIRIHKKIENFYKNLTPDIELKNFINFELTRLKDCKDLKYFYPLFQELKIENQELALKGIIDAVYINQKDDGIIIVDWKTGHFNENEIDNYRFELALYKELYEKNKINKVKYWSIYFTDYNKLFFEEVDEEVVKKMYNKIDKVREAINNGIYNPKKNYYCKTCEFKNKCSLK